MKSEHTKNIQLEELSKLQADVATMDDDSLAKFRNGFDADAMGFSGEEGATE